MSQETQITSTSVPITENPQTSMTSRFRLLLTVKQFCQQHPAFTQSSMRWHLFNREVNGLHRAVFKVGRRIYIDVEVFYTWFDEVNGR